jgi:hypothetical protein
MKRLPFLLLLNLLFAFPASAVSFDFVFDGNFDPGIQTVIGTGSFTFANDPGTGTFAFNSLGAFSMTYSFDNGPTFTQGDIQSDLSQVLVVLSVNGGTRRLQFSDTGTGSGGPFGGSLDLLTAGGAGLSFEPSYFGGGLDLYFETVPHSESGAFGSYLATTGSNGVPDAATTAGLMLPALLGLFAMKRSLRGYSPRKFTPRNCSTS